MILELPDVKIQKIEEPLFDAKNVHVYIQREDEIHPIISGNKWRKLRFNIEKAIQLKKKSLLTFGGAHSNHLHATAEACKLAQLKGIGIVRGERIESQTIIDCEKAGMELHFVSREEYRLHDNKEFLNDLNEKFDYPFIIPQGGNNFYGTLGCTEILNHSKMNPDFIIVGSGTGNTASGILLSLKEHQKLITIPALKGNFMAEEIENAVFTYLMDQETTEEYLSKLEVLNNYHFGGFAKYKPELIAFMQSFYKQHKIKLDPIYTNKVMFALYDLIKLNHFPENSKILAIHTGGLQGIKGFEKRYNLQLFN